MDQNKYVFLLYLLNIILEHKLMLQMSQNEGLCLASTVSQCVYLH